MKYLKHIIVLTGVALLLPSCVDLDAGPDGSNILAGQKNPTMIESDLNSLNSVLIYCGSDDSNNHFDFGYPALCMMYDAMSADVPCPAAGYNWFRSQAEYSDRIYTYDEQRLAWRTYYKYIAVANSAIATLKGSEETGLSKSYLGYAYAARAFAYLNMVQMYAFNYDVIDPATALAVPIVDENTTSDMIANNPRASVQVVYDLILADLGLAIEQLDGATARPNKSYIDLAVAYGLRARANLAMHKYADAAADAKKAQEESKTTLLSRDDVSTPGFNDDGIASVMWAAIVSPTSRTVTTGIINWPSHICTFDTAGYTNVGGVRQINQLLWDLIPADDVRKGWWVDENLESPLIEGMTYEGEPVVEAFDKAFEPFVNVKFHDYENIIGGELNASSWIMMRREEMVLIEAEGLAMSGDLPGGKAVLENWVKTNRNPGYVSSAATPEEFQNEVWFQRRIELWSEGFAYFDLMRLSKNMVRVVEGKPSTYLETQRFNMEANDPTRLWLVPDHEINGNAAVSNADNPITARPTAGAGMGLTDGVVN